MSQSMIDQAQIWNHLMVARQSFYVGNMYGIHVRNS